MNIVGIHRKLRLRELKVLAVAEEAGDRGRQAAKRVLDENRVPPC